MTSDPVTPIVLLVIGLLLIVVEIAIIPGFGIAGVMGMALLGAGTVVIWSLYGATVGAASLVLSAVICVLVIWVFFRSRASRRLILEGQIKGDSSDVPTMTWLKGRQGVVTKPLRPAGTAVIEGDPYDVISEGEFIDQGVAVVVLRIDTNSIVVERQREGD